MLTIDKMPPALYFLSRTGEYHFKGLEPGGVWMGSGAAELGLSGAVTAKKLLPLAEGRLPDGRAVQNAGASNRQTGKNN